MVKEISRGESEVPGLHRLRLDALLHELVNRAEDIIGVEHKLHLLLDAVVSLAGELTLPDTLRRITELAAELSDAQFAALGVIGPDLKLVEFITVGLDPHARSVIGEPPSGQGILGLLIKDPESIRIADLGTHPASFGFPPNHPPMGSFLGVPIRVRNEVFGNLYLTEKRDGGEFTERDEDLMIALAAAAGIAIENARLGEQTRRREIWLAAAAEVTSSLLHGAEAAATSQVVVDKAAEIVEADIALLLLRDPDINSGTNSGTNSGNDSGTDTGTGTGTGTGTDEFVIRAAHGEAAAGSVGQSCRLDPATGRFLDDGQARAFSSGESFLKALSPSAPPTEIVGPGLLVPLGSGDRVLGVLAVVRRADAAPFPEADVRMVQIFADHAALAVEFGRASADRQRLAIYEDRDRIARDLHDLIIQRLFAIGLGMQGLLPKVGDADVAHKLSAYVDDLDATIHDVRRAIFSLQEPEDRPSGLRGAIVRLVSAAAAALQFEPLLTLGGPLDAAVPDEVRHDLLAVVGEGLANVARHSGARSAEVRVSVDTAARTVTAVVEDDGIGPDPADIPGQGTVNLAHRAHRRAGSFQLERREGGGARLAWTVPLDLS